MRRPHLDRRTIATTLLTIGAVVVAAAVVISVTRSQRAHPADDTTGYAGRSASTEQVIAGYPQRRDRYSEILLSRSSSEEPDLGAAQGMVMLSRAERGDCDADCVADANQRIRASALLMRTGDRYRAAPNLGGVLTYLRVYLLFRDSDLMEEDTRDVLRVRLRAEYLGHVLSGFGSVDIETNNPYDPTAKSGGQSENHRIQVIVTGLLLSEAFAEESFAGRPIKGGADSYADYYKQAYLNNLSAWRGEPRNSFKRDVLYREKDSPDYLTWHIGDHWLVRDLVPDPVLRKHAEIMIDRLLAEWAEDLVGPWYTGKTGRNYAKPHPEYGAAARTTVLNYLIFDNLGYPLPDDFDLINSWGRWAWQSIVTSEYGPQHPDFPRVVIEVGRNKGAGYLVRTGGGEAANWVENDFALGFPADTTVSVEQQLGGFFTGRFTGPLSGSRVIPYLKSASGADADSPFRKDKPAAAATGVLSRRLGILSYRKGSSPAHPRLWVEDGFDEVVRTEPWLFVSMTTLSREVYLAVRPVHGAFSPVGEIDGGQVLELDRGDALVVWEVGTSDSHTSFAAFMHTVRGNDLTTSPEAVTYRSPSAGTSVTWRRDGTHHVNGTPIDSEQFDFSFNNPYLRHRYGRTTAVMQAGPYAAHYDWTPTADRDFDTMPTKKVVNR